MFCLCIFLSVFWVYARTLSGLRPQVVRYSSMFPLIFNSFFLLLVVWLLYSLSMIFTIVYFFCTESFRTKSYFIILREIIGSFTKMMEKLTFCSSYFKLKYLSKLTIIKFNSSDYNCINFLTSTYFVGKRPLFFP